MSPGSTTRRPPGARRCSWEGGTAFDLNTLLVDGGGWTLQSAEGINDRGQIVGYGQFGGQTRAYLLTPAVPEPSGFVLAGFGGLAVLGQAWRRARTKRRSPSALQESFR